MPVHAPCLFFSSFTAKAKRRICIINIILHLPNVYGISEQKKSSKHKKSPKMLSHPDHNYVLNYYYNYIYF